MSSAGWLSPRKLRRRRDALQHVRQDVVEDRIPGQPEVLLADARVDVRVEVVDLEPVQLALERPGSVDALGVRPPHQGPTRPEPRRRLRVASPQELRVLDGVLGQRTQEPQRHELRLHAHRQGHLVPVFAGDPIREDHVARAHQRVRRLFVQEQVEEGRLPHVGAVVGQVGHVDARAAKGGAQRGLARVVVLPVHARVAVAGVVGVRRVQVHDGPPPHVTVGGGVVRGRGEDPLVRGWLTRVAGIARTSVAPIAQVARDHVVGVARVGVHPIRRVVRAVGCGRIPLAGLARLARPRVVGVAPQLRGVVVTASRSVRGGRIVATTGRYEADGQSEWEQNDGAHTVGTEHAPDSAPLAAAEQPARRERGVKGAETRDSARRLASRTRRPRTTPERWAVPGLSLDDDATVW